ncbi:MAG: FAD-dependent oxidoreductase [Bacteroidales bacterium]
MSINRRNFLKGSFVLAGGLLIPAHLARCKSSADDQEYEIVIYGATSGGIAAAIQASRLGLSVILIEPSSHLGGLTTGGLGQTDSGRTEAIGGISREFYQRLRKYYENDDAWIQEPSTLQEGQDAVWRFEPHVAMKVYKEMLDEANVPLVMNERLVLSNQGVEKSGNRITSILTEKGNVYKGRIFIDATYEGDLLAMAGVSYHVGREANAVYGETLNGVQTVRTNNHIFPGFVDPYVIPGNPDSGILPGVHGEDPGRDGEGDHRVQAYCFRMCLTDAPDNRIAFQQPDSYDELEYELLFRNFEAGENRIPWLPGRMPNRKTDTNNRCGFSTNKIGINYEYPDGDYAIREAIINEQEHYQKGLMWTLANHPRVPADVREEVSKWGLAADEFQDNGNWPTQIYVREARRLKGEYVMTEHDCRRTRVVNDPVGLGSYAMDSHNVQRYITRMGCVQNEGNIEVSPGGPYAISYRSMLPKKDECENLLVCCAISSSHISFGSIRMEPVFMILGHSAATAAAQSLEEGSGLHNLDYSRLRQQLIREDQRLDVEINQFPPLPPDKELPKQRIIHSSEPVLENACIVRG